MANVIVVDFSEAGEGGAFNTKLVPDGDYVAKVTKVDVGESKAGNKQAVFTLELISPKVPRATYPVFCALSGKGAFKLRDLMKATGLKAAGGRMKLDVDKLVGRTLGVEMVEEEYNERLRSTIDNMFPRSEVTPHDAEIEGDDDDEEEEAPAPRTRKKAAPVVEEEDEFEEEPAPKPKRRAKPAPEPEPEEDEELEDDDEEEEPEPPKRKRAVKKKAPVVEDEDDDDIDLDDI